MIFKNVLTSSLTVAILFGATHLVSANTNLTYPPVNVFNSNNNYTQAPVAPTYGNNAPYVFGQNSQQNNSNFIPSPQQAQQLVKAPAQPQAPQINRVPPFAPNNFGNRSNNNFSNNMPFSNTNMMPFSNSNSNGFNPFNKGNMPFANSGGMVPTNPMNNMFGNNNNQNFNMPFMNRNTNRKKAWGDTRHIWPDFYTDFTDESWDTMMSSPREMGRMPGGWRFPYISMPDPVTVSDAITNQFPPIAEEAANMADFSDWGVFDK